MNSLKIIQGDITKLKIECIVNAANKSLLGGGGVDGAIHRAAGPKLFDECLKLGGCETGKAKITGGYNLPCKYVIHTVGPVYGLGEEKIQNANLLMCYYNSLLLAKENDIHSIAFPSISTGIYGFPHDKACKIALNAVKAWFANNPDYNIEIVFCCYDSETFSLYNKKLQSII